MPSYIIWVEMEDTDNHLPPLQACWIIVKNNKSIDDGNENLKMKRIKPNLTIQRWC